MNKEIDEREERWGKVKWLKEKIIDIPKKVILGKIRKHPERCLIRYYILWIFIAIIGIVVYLKLPLEEPLPINYGMSWVILTLISMITLSYVEFINRLKDIVHSDKEESKTIEASGIICMLVVALLLFFITILALVIRIVLLSFDPVLAEHVYRISVANQTIGNETIGNRLATSLPFQTLLIFDYIMVFSLIAGSIMRFYIFGESYGKDLWRKKQYKLDKKDKWFPLEELMHEEKKKEEESKVLQKAFLLSKVAKEQFDLLPKEDQNRVEEILYYLNEPEKKRMLDIKKLKGLDGKDLFLLRIEDYNVVFFEEVNSFRITQFREEELAQ